MTGFGEQDLEWLEVPVLPAGHGHADRADAPSCRSRPRRTGTVSAVQALAPARTPEGKIAMPPAPPAVEAVTGTRDQARPTGTPAPAAAPGGRGRRKAQMLPLRRSARFAQTALPAVACQEEAGRARPEERGNRRRRMAGLPRRVPKIARIYRDPLFDRPDLVESDYYRLLNYPQG
jgi:hypothetical protein